MDNARPAGSARPAPFDAAHTAPAGPAGPAGEIDPAVPADSDSGMTGSGAATAEPGSSPVRPAADASDRGASGAPPTAGEERVVIRDNRKIDLSDGKAGAAARASNGVTAEGSARGDATRAAGTGDEGSSEPDGAAAGTPGAAGNGGGIRSEAVAEAGPAGENRVETASPLGAELEALRGELDERTKDLQRVSAEYANYRKRVERDRTAVIEQATGVVLLALLPVLDDLDRAREHGDLVGPFGAVAEQLTGALAKFGLTAFGAKGDRFDPTRHEAVAHTTSSEVTEPTCVDVMRRGYLLGERLLRPALVAVADPEQ